MYCNNNPLNRADPTGLIAPVIVVGGYAVLQFCASNPQLVESIINLGFMLPGIIDSAIKGIQSWFKPKDEPNTIADTDTSDNKSQIYYRGLSAQDLIEYEETGQMFSYAIRKMGHGGAEKLLNKGNFVELAKKHQYDSSNPASPFISLTTNRETAEMFSDTGKIAIIQTDRAVYNTENPLNEDEYLVPLAITTPEVVSIQDVPNE